MLNVDNSDLIDEGMDEDTISLEDSESDVEVIAENDEVADLEITDDTSSEEEERTYERLHYHRIPININGGEPVKGLSYKSKSEPIFIWYRTASVEDYMNDADALRSARVTDIMVNAHNRDSILTRKGYICLENSLTPRGHITILCLR